MSVDIIISHGKEAIFLTARCRCVTNNECWLNAIAAVPFFAPSFNSFIPVLSLLLTISIDSILKHTHSSTALVLLLRPLSPAAVLSLSTAADAARFIRATTHTSL